MGVARRLGALLGLAALAGAASAASISFAAAAPTIAADVSELLERLRMAGWVFFSSAARL
jgi:Na+/proline symporter